MKFGRHKLQVWQEGIELVVDLYKITNSFPKSETYGLTSQIRRAVVSIPSNIAEGAGRKSKKEFLHYLDISRGFSQRTRYPYHYWQQTKLHSRQSYSRGTHE